MSLVGSALMDVLLSIPTGSLRRYSCLGRSPDLGNVSTRDLGTANGNNSIRVQHIGK